MDLELWRRLRELSEACAARPAAERAGWLEANVSDPALRARVKSMLEDEDTPTQPGTWEGAVADLASAASRDNQQLGAWRLIQPIGDGGMGTVYLAERIEGGFSQQAAIKCLRRGWLTEEFIGRFESERQILARLEHPGIARLLDGGRDANGEPWLAMEYVDGSDLIAYCDQHRLGLAERLRLFRIVCAAVSHAHTRLIVHRDIKPSNVLVNADGQVKLLDFGVAKLLDDGADAYRTGTALAPMTPAYAAPEQLRGESPSTAMDIYTLGVVLFELMSGVLPYRMTGDSGAEAAAAILNSHPVAASNAYQRHSTNPTDRARIAEARKQSPRALRRALSGDLDAVLMKALRADPAKRYQTVLALSNDIERYLQHRPVMARRGNWRYRAGLFLRRHALASGLAVALFAALLAGLLHARHQARLVAEQRDLAVHEAQRATEALGFLRETFRMAHPSRNQGRHIDVLELLLKGHQRLLERSDAGGSVAMRAWLMEEMAETEQALGLVTEPEELLRVASDLYQQSGQAFDAGRAQVQLGWLMTRTDSDAAAEAMVRDGLARLQSDDRPGSNPSQRLAVLARAHHVLGMALGNRGQREDAALELRAARKLWRESGTPLHQGPSSTIMVLAYFLGSLDQGEDAERLLRETGEELAAIGPDADSERAEILMTLGINLRRDGRFEEARALEEAAVGIHRSLLGEEHSVYWTGVGNLGTVLTNLGEHEQGVAMQRGRLDFRRRVLGEDSPRTGQTWRRYAAALHEAGRLEEAEQAMHTSLEILRREDPEQAQNDVSFLVVMSRLRLGMGDLEAAEALADEAQDSLAQRDDDHPPNRIAIAQVKAQLRLESGREREACELANDARDLAATIGSSLRIEPRERLALVNRACDLLFADPEHPVGSDPLEGLGPAVRRSLDPAIQRLITRVRQLSDQRPASKG